MMEGTCQTCIKQLIDAKELELAHPTQSASDRTTQEEAAQSQSTGERSFAQFQKASNNLKDWRAVKQNFREEKSMERQSVVHTNFLSHQDNQLIKIDHKMKRMTMLLIMSRRVATLTWLLLKTPRRIFGMHQQDLQGNSGPD